MGQEKGQEGKHTGRQFLLLVDSAVCQACHYDE